VANDGRSCVAVVESAGGQLRLLFNDRFTHMFAQVQDFSDSAARSAVLPSFNFGRWEGEARRDDWTPEATTRVRGDLEEGCQGGERVSSSLGRLRGGGGLLRT
jgi:hypothetical protein